MKIYRLIYGHEVTLEIEKIRDYPKFGLYQVYRLENGVRIPVYQKSFTNFELKEIRENGYRIRGDW